MADVDTMQMDKTGAGTEKAPTGHKLREQTTAVAQDLKELGRLTKEASQEKLQQAKEVASDYVEKGREKVGKVEDSVVHYVRENPIKSVALAVGAGALLGFLLSRR